MNNDIRKQFPILNNITYFDSAALVLKPTIATNAITEYYTNKSISSRTADTPLGNEINQTIIKVRNKVADLLDAKDSEIIFTSGTTESINIFVRMFSQLIKKDEVILLSSFNHSSNIIPWIEISKQSGAIIKFSENLIDDIDNTPNLKIVSLAQETNNFNQNFDLNKIYKLVKEKNAYLFNDAAQAIAHQKVSFSFSDAIAFSTNKFYGPTGLGVLAVKTELLKQMKPVKFGGGAIDDINTDTTWTLKKTIAAFEPGTPDIAGMYMFNKSLDFFNEIGYQKTQEILKKLSIYLHEQLSKLENIEVFSKPGDYIALINIKGINSQDVATYLGSKHIYTIAGIFCAPYLRNIKQEYSYLRISLAIYNNYEDIDKLIETLKNGGDFYAF
ncbi:aminotransferase class V-fold PLP-dependent enzyme [Mycoplasma sp. CSL10166]|uniref:aminotransferase class V-fold PLP-dependent enzyme n=1 Tax=Mycoplasma sp. CSL10166 TaxID=2813825 RepID=UPI00197C1972|nr:aminotransferase class V-fold PLP-dependent enzyme [Mycoplasma sp. CSL10166]MBN4084400.1 aminotransferase class V-fold PLP-dependent enzyme [Mycoplasma sp. CSL10166]